MQRRIVSIIVLCGVLIAQCASAQYVGVQTIGLSAWGDKDVEGLESVCLVAKPPQLGIALLPFEFNSARPFGAIDKFMRDTLSTYPGEIRVTLYLFFQDQH